MGSRECLDDDHIVQVIALLGPLPKDLRIAWPRYRNYFDDQDTQPVFVVDWAPSIESFDEDMIDGQHPEESSVDLTNGDADEAARDRCMGPGPEKEVPVEQLYPSLVELYNQRLSHNNIPDLDDGPDANAGSPEPPLRDRWFRDKHPDMDSEESDAVASFLEQILQYDPAARPTTTELLKHPWIEKFCAGKTNSMP